MPIHSLFRRGFPYYPKGYTRTNLPCVRKVKYQFALPDKIVFPKPSETRYSNEGIPRTFEYFEVKYGPYAESIWESATPGPTK